MFVIFMALLWNQTFPELIYVFIYSKNAGIQPFFFLQNRLILMGQLAYVELA